MPSCKLPTRFAGLRKKSSCAFINQPPKLNRLNGVPSVIMPVSMVASSNTPVKEVYPGLGKFITKIGPSAPCQSVFAITSPGISLCRSNTAALFAVHSRWFPKQKDSSEHIGCHRLRRYHRPKLQRHRLYELCCRSSSNIAIPNFSKNHEESPNLGGQADRCATQNRKSHSSPRQNAQG